jgi:hypothetical protein
MEPDLDHLHVMVVDIGCLGQIASEIANFRGRPFSDRANRSHSVGSFRGHSWLGD